MKFITGSKRKLDEVRLLIPDIVQEDIDLPEIQELDPQKIIEEKVLVARKHISTPFIVEDVSFCIDDLNGLPGPLIKWFLKSIDNAKIYEMARDSKAVVRATIGYFDGSKTHFFVGEVHGVLVPSVRDGFGFDPIFMPDGFDKTFEEMSDDEKSSCSHRGLAIKKLLAHINK